MEARARAAASREAVVTNPTFDVIHRRTNINGLPIRLYHRGEYKEERTELNQAPEEMCLAFIAKAQETFANAGFNAEGGYFWGHDARPHECPCVIAKWFLRYRG